MMTARQEEADPAGYAAVAGVTGTALATAWQRIEHYIAWRFTPREVVWRVLSDGGEWLAPLAPVVSLVASVGGETPYEPERGPMGGWMLPSGIVTATASVGAGPVPAAVAEAVKRLADYMAADSVLPAGARSYSANVGQLSETISADAAHAGRAMQNSGAADLLRKYRKVASWA